MPYIVKKKNKTYQRHGKAKAIYTNVYNTSNWRKLREAYLMAHPICEKCHKELATEVHHIVPISTQNDPLKMKEIGFNAENLQALCSKCHDEIHTLMKK